jgi:hypothetical protein
MTDELFFSDPVVIAAMSGKKTKEIEKLIRTKRLKVVRNNGRILYPINYEYMRNELIKGLLSNV